MEPKIVTCCYCGTRAALVLAGRHRHELACASCGAPLHALKSLPRSRPGPDPVRPVLPPHPKRPKRPKKRRKPRKSFAQKLFSEAMDALEDLID